jgi:hypothetical protein
MGDFVSAGISIASSCRPFGLKENVFYDVAVDIGEAEIATCVAAGEGFIIDSEEMDRAFAWQWFSLPNR